MRDTPMAKAGGGGASVLLVMARDISDSVQVAGMKTVALPLAAFEGSGASCRLATCIREPD
jgi:hypothetical protein